MTPDRTARTVRFIQRMGREARLDKIRITFHGGEPLAAGYRFFEDFLDQLTSGDLPSKGVELSLQSNLWLLDDAYCRLFRKCRVSIGTSLDGPEPINDAQRGAGYFRRTMAGIHRARSSGLDVGCIATFTRSSAPFWREIADFFLSENLSFSVHASLPALHDPNNRHALSPEDMAGLFRSLLDYYIRRRKEVVISTFDQMAKSIPARKGHICTFQDCLGMFLAIEPAGGIFPCQRLCGNPQYRLGHVDDDPSLDDLFASPVALRLKERERRTAEDCGDCQHYPYCKGGCAYNAWAGGESAIKDPYCAAYADIFGTLQERLFAELGSEDNIAAIACRPAGTGVEMLLKQGPLIDIVRTGPHPSQIARNAKRIVAAVELARGPDASSVAARLVAMGICRNQTRAEVSLRNLMRSLDPDRARLNNLYLHVTFACQLRCTHCYAQSGGASKAEMPLASLEELIGEAARTGFRQVIITGGEPLLHSRRDEMLAMLRGIKPAIGPMNLVLRTNLAMRWNDNGMTLAAGAFDQIVVSIDGDRAGHDARRGPGSYDAAVANMEAYQRLASGLGGAAELSIAAVLSPADVNGDPGWAVRRLAERLNVRRTRFRPLLPLGRAAGWDEPPQSAALGGHLDPMELIESGFRPVANCGLGQNLYVEPSGESFPCYSYHRPHAYLGNVIANGLASIIEKEPFRILSRHTVDTNPACRLCEYRYLCGGPCRAWGGESAQGDLDAPPADCAGLRQRAAGLFHAARGYLEID